MESHDDDDRRRADQRHEEQAILAAWVCAAVGLAFGLIALSGGPLTATASAAAGWLAFQAGVELRTRDLATLLFSYLTIGTVFAMITAADPRWWERHFSALGSGWAFNVTMIVAGLLVATIGSYIGRDLHR